ncbi:MAG: outer membrane protein assembly factor BamB [Planctomycetota bacterium]|jgi:outer membrane protein assembly factor BamB
MATNERLRQRLRFPVLFVAGRPGASKLGAGKLVRCIMTVAMMALATMALATKAVAQHTPRRTVPKPIDFATSQNDNLFSLVRSQDDIHSLERALEELTAGKHNAAVRRLHELLRVDPHGVVPVAPGRFLGLRTAVVTVLANMSPTAKDAYEQLALREAGTLLRRDLKQLSPRQLNSAAERFPTTRKGFAARLLLGDRALEAGNGLLAARHYRSALDAAPIASADEKRVVQRLAFADVLVEPRTARAAQSAERLAAGSGDALSVLRPATDRFSAIGGGRSGATPMAEPVGNPAAFWRQPVTAPGFERREKGQLAMFTVGDLDGMFINTGHELIALDPLRKEVKWVSHSPIRDFAGEVKPKVQRPINRGRRFRGRRGGNADPADAINPDMVLAAAVTADVVVVALEVPDNSKTVTFQKSFEVISKIPRRRMFGFSRLTGKLMWQHFDEIDGPWTRRFRGQDSCGPPIIAGNVVYAPIQDRTGAIAFSIGAYDLQTGALLWKRLVCSSQQDVNMFGNARMEFASSPLALQGGVIYGATNLGVAYAVDALSGRIRWITSYDVVYMPKARLHGQADRQVFFSNNAPVVANGVVCLTPLDSQFALGVDIDSGTILWRLPYDATIGGIENRVQWLCGAIDDEFIFSGAGVVAAKARPEGTFGTTPVYRQMVRPDQIGDRRMTRLPGRAAVSADHVWVPTRDRVLAFDRAGNPHEDHARIQIDGYQPGNLMMVDGVLTSVRNRSFDLVLDSKALLARSRESAKDSPNDPNSLLRLATLQDALLNAASTVAERTAVQELYRRGLQACIDSGLPKGHPTRIALQRELFEQALQVADTAARAGSRDALAHLAAARDLAPDNQNWLLVQTQVLAGCRSNRKRFLSELDLLEQHAPTARMPAPLRITVSAFVLWQRALAYANEPARATEMWQRMLEQYGEEVIGPDSVATMAEAAINDLIKTHGKSAYASVAKRADEALTAAGESTESLHALTQRYPNSDAARRAGLLLLDRAVEEGNLAVACDVLARANRTDTIVASVLRRVQVAALRRGNTALATVMAERIRATPDAPSDWPNDAGSTFAEAADKAVASIKPNIVVSTELPSVDALTVPPRIRQEYLRMLPTRTGRGFGRPNNTPLYVVAGSELVAFDLEDGKRSELFSEPVEFLEHVLICGNTLVVPDMERVFAVDYRTGKEQWELEFEHPRLIESLGITNGVLHVSAQPTIPDGNSELIGIEPITGTRLFTRSLGARQLKPKPIHNQLLLMSVARDGMVVERIDPVTGKTTATISCKNATTPGLLELRPDSLATRLYPQGMTGDDDRIYLPVDGRSQSALPQVIAIDNAGKIAWHWRGEAGSVLLLAQRRSPHFVVAVSNDQGTSRMFLLDMKTGKELRSADLGHDASVLNWERSWLDNPVPATIAVGSQMDRQSRQRQLVCFAVDPGPTFAIPLKPDDGDIERTPQFGVDKSGSRFVTFGVRPRRAGGSFRLYAIDITTRRGAFPGGQKTRAVKSRGAPHGMTGTGPYTVLSTTQGLILLGDKLAEKR